MQDFLPVTREDMKSRGWDELDFVYVTGDAYVDHPSFGSAIIGRLLESRGYRVGMIPQPDWRKKESIQVFGEPRLGFLVTAGNMDSMVNHYTVSKKHRSTDAYSPGGKMGLRPDRASVVYSNLIRQTYKHTPIILGGIEASLRRMAHYDYWENKVKHSILIDSGADLISYGMGEHSILEIAEALQSGIPVQEMDAIAVSGGPGSFTGLRIGSATAKGLGLALSIPIISVPTVDAIAYNLCGTDAVVCPLMDARRNQTYTGLYTFDGDQMKCISGQKAVMLGEIIDEINQLGRKVIFLGDGIPVFKPYIEEHIQVPHSYAPIHLSQQRAGALGALALQYYHEGKYESAAEHQPDYLRLSQAERELAAKKGQEKA